MAGRRGRRLAQGREVEEETLADTMLFGIIPVYSYNP
jgi:hypothetical protein